jgi:hypothetical protein
MFVFVPPLISALGAIGTVLTTIGPALSSFATTIGPVLTNIIRTTPNTIETISKFANAFLQVLSILKPGEQIDEIGDRALQAKDQGITMDKFDNFDDYMTALRNFQVDPEVSKNRDVSEKLVAGIAVTTVGMEDKFNAERGSLNGLWLLPLANPAFFTPERMQSLLIAGRLGADILGYLNKSISGSETRNVEKCLEINPDGSPMDKPDLNKLYDALDSARSNWADLAKQVEKHNNTEEGV